MIDLKLKNLLCALGLILPVAVLAAPANPEPFIIQGPDGKEMKVTLHGDENCHWLTTEDGRIWSLNADGHAEAIKSRPSVTFRKIPKRLMGNDGVPTKGSVKGLVILAEFQDMGFSRANDQVAFDKALNLEGYDENGATGSVKDYFIDQSAGMFTPEFDVVGPLKLSNDMAYYGADFNGATDPNAYKMIAEVCQAAHEEGVDFSRYDNDGDGEVDLVYVIYAGYSQSNGASVHTIWPHMWFLKECNCDLELDGVKVNRYACSAERSGISGDTMAGIGLFCHEFSHTLGLPDVYDVGYGSTTLKMGGWDVMDSGCYNNSMRSPSGYSSYEKMELGWINPIEIQGDEGSLSLPPLSSGVAYRMTNPENPDEYYLFETRTNSDRWDRYIPAEGMLVLHVDYDENIWEGNKVNTGSNWRMHLVPANGNFTSSTNVESVPFPGSTGVIHLTDLTTPSTIFNDGTSAEIPITEIFFDGETTTFTVGANLPSPLPAAPSKFTSDGFRANWESVNEAKSYSVRLTAKSTGEVKQFDKIIKNYYTFIGLDPEETYEWSVRAVGEYLISDWSESSEVNLAVNEVTGIHLMDKYARYYNFQGGVAGTEKESLDEGIFIEVLSDGSTRKVVISK